MFVDNVLLLIFKNKIKPKFIYSNENDYIHNGKYRRIAQFLNFLGFYFHTVSVNGYFGLIPPFDFYQNAEAVVKAGLIIAPVTTFLVGLLFLGYALEYKTNFIRFLLCLLITGCQLTYMIIWTIKLELNAEKNNLFLFEFGWVAFSCFMVGYFATIFDFMGERDAEKN